MPRYNLTFINEKKSRNIFFKKESLVIKTEKIKIRTDKGLTHNICEILKFCSFFLRLKKLTPSIEERGRGKGLVKPQREVDYCSKLPTTSYLPLKEIHFE